MFQFTLPRGERQAGKGNCLRVAGVSIHAPAWGATSPWPAMRAAAAVSIHAPAWGATDGQRENGDDALVSIHAPAWGATVPLIIDQRIRSVSIHAPAWGATENLTNDPDGRTFQFTLPRGERHNSVQISKSPARFNSRSRVGSDGRRGLRRPWWLGFNSRSRVGSDLTSTAGGSPGSKFQFTLPRGERRCSRAAPVEASCFNSRSRVGSDACRRLRPRCNAMFQFTLPRGERPECKRELDRRQQFQFTLPRGERLPLSLPKTQTVLFQFTLPRGERLAGNKARGCGGLFPVLRRV